MTLTYRTTGAWGAGKGAPLTNEEGDGNIYDLDQRVMTIEENPSEPLQISNVTRSGNQLIFHLSDGTTTFTVTLPTFQAPVVEEVADDAFTPTASDSDKYFRCTNELGCVVTVPDNASVPLPLYGELHFYQASNNPVTFVAESTDVTINPESGFDDATAGLGAVVTLKKVGENEFDLFGRKAASESA